VTKAACGAQAPPSAAAYARQMTRRRPSEPIYDTAIVAGRGLFGLWGLKRRVRGVEHVPVTGGAVLAMTHFGYLDFALVEWVTCLANRRRIRFMAKQGAFDKPVVGWLLRGMRHIAVDMKAGASAYAKAVTALRAGELLGVFPEAGVSASFTVRELKTGAVRLAAEAGAPIIPVAVWGGQRLLTKRRRIGFFERFGVPVTFAFGAPVIVRADDDPKQATDRLRSPPGARRPAPARVPRCRHGRVVAAAEPGRHGTHTRTGGARGCRARPGTSREVLSAASDSGVDPITAVAARS
jgi:1-acyl-sn-glycerol-3-phosphate acyltransferase